MNRNEMEPAEYNAEVASRLRGLAAMVESCDEKVKIKMSAHLKWSSSGDEFRTAILNFDTFADRFSRYITEKLLELLRKGDPEQTAPLIKKLEEFLKTYDA